MTEHTLHSAGLWIDAAISHVSLKQRWFYHCQTTWLTGRGRRSTAVFVTKSI